MTLERGALQARLRQRRVRLPVAALLGAAGVLCFAPFELFWLAPLVWAGFFWLLTTEDSPAQAARTGFAFGLGFFLCGVSWVYVSLSVFGGMPWWLAGPAAFLFCAVLALFPTLAGAAFQRWQPAAFWRQALWFAALLATADWLRGWVFTGFPWLALGYSQTPPSPLAGWVPLLGVHGLSLLVALISASLLRWRQGLALAAALSAIGLGLAQIEWTAPSGPPVRVALLQGNVPQEMKFRPEAFFKTLALYERLIDEHPAQLTLLPETAFPVFLQQLPQDYLDRLHQLAARQNGVIVFGAITGDTGNYFNSAASIGASPMQVYSKQHLVPYGEFIPPGFDWFMAYANIPASSFSRGPLDQPPLAVAGQRVAIDICYEDVFGEEIIRALPAAGILANLSNTAWFGRSLAQPQHLQIARLRALESGRPMLRATNTGMTAIIAHTGEVEGVLPPFVSDALTGEVQARSGLTPYARFGNLPAVALMLLCGIVAIARKKHIR